MYTFDLAIFARQFPLCIFFSCYIRSTSFTSSCTILDVLVFIIVLKRKVLFYYFINFHRHIFEIFLNGKYMTFNSGTILLFFGWETDIHKYTLSGWAIKYIMDVYISWCGFEIFFFKETFQIQPMPKNYKIQLLSPHVCLNKDLINYLFTKKSIIFYIPKANPTSYTVTCKL